MGCLLACFTCREKEKGGKGKGVHSSKEQPTKSGQKVQVPKGQGCETGTGANWFLVGHQPTIGSHRRDGKVQSPWSPEDTSNEPNRHVLKKALKRHNQHRGKASPVIDNVVALLQPCHRSSVVRLRASSPSITHAPMGSLSYGDVSI